MEAGSVLAVVDVPSFCIPINMNYTRNLHGSLNWFGRLSRFRVKIADACLLLMPTSQAKSR